MIDSAEVFHIAVSCNERYVPGALEALAGVAVYAKLETALRFHVFTEGVKDESIAFMRATLKRLHPNCELEQHICNEELLKGLPYWAGSRMAAVRCYYATLMPDVDWCLYLDCDVLYLASVEEHFSYWDPSVYACVVLEEHERTRTAECNWIVSHCVPPTPSSLLPTPSNYFNSGVVLFNFKKMREDGIPEKLVQFFKDHPDVPSPDQDALNATFGGNIKLLPPKFDRLQIYLTDEKVVERPVIHYVNGNPWLPKYGVVMNNRFRLWHAFADKYIWQKRGESYRKLFTRKMLVAKWISWVLLKLPGIGSVYAWVMFKLDLTINAKVWHDSQVEHDFSLRKFVEMGGMK